jgi:WD40 repeat protein
MNTFYFMLSLMQILSVLADTSDLSRNQRKRAISLPKGPTLLAHTELIFAVVVPNDNDLATGASNNILIWDQNTYALKRNITGDQFHYLDKLPNGDLISGNLAGNGSVQIWNTVTGALKRTIKDIVVADSVILSNGNLAIATGDKINIYNQATGQLIRVVPGNGNNEFIFTIELLRNGFLAIGYYSNIIRILDTRTWQVVREIETQSKYIWKLTSLPNGDLISSYVSTNNSNRQYGIQLWEPLTGKLKKTLITSTSFISEFTLLKNGEVAFASNDFLIKIWNIYEGVVKRTLRGHTDAISSMAQLNNCDLVASSFDLRVRVWDI